jgi:hypothetical protein
MILTIDSIYWSRYFFIRPAFRATLENFAHKQGIACETVHISSEPRAATNPAYMKDSSLSLSQKTTLASAKVGDPFVD